MPRSWCCVWLLVIACRAGGQSQDEPRAPASKPQVAPAAHGGGGLVWDAVPPLVRHEVTSPVRIDEYRVATDPRAELAVFRFDAGEGSSVESHQALWLSQFEQADGSDTAQKAKRDEFSVGGLRVNTIEVTGIFTGPMEGQPSAAPATESTLLGAIVSGGPRGLVLFRFTGPRGSVESARYAYDRLVHSVRPQ
ncbi:MAG TPA: hypothetical protein VJV78_20875 [Polyangiales bacterium]|nr:hypothetical protein [Polyangiales bacterium]